MNVLVFLQFLWLFIREGNRVLIGLGHINEGYLDNWLFGRNSDLFRYMVAASRFNMIALVGLSTNGPTVAMRWSNKDLPNLWQSTQWIQSVYKKKQYILLFNMYIADGVCNGLCPDLTAISWKDSTEIRRNACGSQAYIFITLCVATFMSIFGVVYML